MKSSAALSSIVGFGLATAQSVTTSIPPATGTELSDSAIVVSGSFDGGMKFYDRSPRVCQDQSETGRDDAMFIVEEGGTLSNVIIGPDQAEGVHCLGTCTLNNVWHSDVCEDAITIEDTGTGYINGGGAFHASDKIIQLNGGSNVEVTDFYAEDYGKVVRSCGNCQPNGGPRLVTLTNVVAVDGGVLCGVNANYGDVCTINNSCQSNGKFCDRFEGNDKGDEPTKLGSGPDGQSCIASGQTDSC
ncbi:pectate lyase domain-containing protein [Sarocladium implicatum]|nr:pectate lyase domain-containing protein [Sarocladium implicatum]